MLVIQMFSECANAKKPLLSELSKNKPLQNKSQILNYLRQGKITAAAPGVPVDIVLQERIKGYKTILSDGTYEWQSELIHYIDKYNMKLPDEFIEHVLKQTAKA